MRGAIPEITALEISYAQTFSGVRKGDLRREPTRDIGAMDTFVLGDMSHLEVAVGRRGPDGAAARAAWSSWVV